MSKGAIRVDWFPVNALAGMKFLTPMEELAYRRIIDLLYTEGGALPDDDETMAEQTRTFKEWKKVKAGLIRKEKISITDGQISASADFCGNPRYVVEGEVARRSLYVVVRAFILERDGYQCQYCMTLTGPMEVDHVMPVARGGSDDFDNLVCACRKCNRSKGAKLVSEWRCEA